MMVPTTGAVLHLCALVPRPGLPHGAAFAMGDYRPLALSTDYRALAGPEGPIARHLGAAIPPHELRLSGAPDGGRSWEVPVALAHLLLSRGWVLARPDEPADLRLWATGAVDLDMRLLPGDYALDRKIAVSQAELTMAGDAAFAVLPPGPGQDAARTRLRAMGIRTVHPEKLDEVLRELGDHPGAGTPDMARHRPARLRPALFAAASAVVVAIAAAALIRPMDDGGQVTANLLQLDALGALNGELAALAPVAVDNRAAPEESEQPPGTDLLQPDTAAPPAIQLAEVRVSAGTSCRPALFDPARRILVPVVWGPDGFSPSMADPSLCGVALSMTDGSAPPAVQSEPPDAFVEAPGPGNTRVLFLREGFRNVLYAFPDLNGGAGDAPIRHQIVVPDP